MTAVMMAWLLMIDLTFSTCPLFQALTYLNEPLPISYQIDFSFGQLRK